MKRKQYNKEEVVEIIAEFFFEDNAEEYSSVPFEKVYSEIVKYAEKNYPKVKMPNFSQARKYIISELSSEHLLEKGEQISTETASKLKMLYYDKTAIEDVLNNEYEVTTYTDDPIICKIKLSSNEVLEVLDMFAEGIRNEKNKSFLWGRIDTIQKLCKRIKKRNKKLILAVVPEFNRMIYINEKGKIASKMQELDPICDTLCMFVRNTPKGRELVEKMTHQPHLFSDEALENS